jgi:vitamin B12 transporter
MVEPEDLPGVYFLTRAFGRKARMYTLLQQSTILFHPKVHSQINTMTRKFFAFVLCLFSCAILNAQSDSTRILDEVVVTANRFPQKQINTGKVMSVINKKDIDQSGLSTLGELLSRQTGITVIGANNAPGTNNDIYVRGTATGNTLILVDGMPAADVSTIRGTFDINFIPLGEIERIEIVKSGQSTLYGSDAVGGVINIITQSAQSKKLTTHGSLSTGSFGTNQMDVSAASKTAKGHQLKVQFNRMQSTGFSAALDKTGKNNFDADGMSSRFFKVHFQTAANKKISWYAGTQISNYNAELDNSGYQDARDFTVKNENLQANAGWVLKLKRGSLHGNVNINNSQRNYLDDSIHLNGFSKFVSSKYEGNSTFAEVYGTFGLTKNIQLFAGIDNRWFNTGQSYLSISDFGKFETALAADSARIRVTSAVASLVWQLRKGLQLESGARFNNHSQYGNNFTYTFNPSWIINKSFKIAYNLSSAFKAPTLYQLYDGFSGQRNLMPETSVTSELSFNYMVSGEFSARATLYSRRIRNGIDYDYVNYKYFNYNGQKDRGVELEARYQKKRWDANMNLTLISGEVTTRNFEYDPSSFGYKEKGDTTYNNLFRVPGQSLNFSIAYNAGKNLTVSITQRVAGKRYEPLFGGAPVLMKAYETTDLFAQLKLGKRLKLFTTIRNIFNEDYQEVLGYGARGRNFTAGIRW